MRPALFENTPSFWCETLRSFGHIGYGGADFAEVLTTAQRIREGDFDSWCDEWLPTADRVAEVAREAERRQHPASARDAWLRASNSYRSAEFFLHGNPGDLRIEHAYGASVAAFRSATALSGRPVAPVEIPFEDHVPHSTLLVLDDELGAHGHAGARRLASARIADRLDETLRPTA
ncbi:hypothetical protein [Streptomyces sp. WAC06614]|uniref:hypothetical protein n=1 Tax=Streptomyces sp. WAC06614 TaxID=2487416 RepID=UPI0021AF8FE7|nr:hypothetical protein [Streptomyces sp. WAC06614]